MRLFPDQLFSSTRKNDIAKQKRVKVRGGIRKNSKIYRGSRGRPCARKGQSNTRIAKINQQEIDLVPTWEHINVNNAADPIIPFFEEEGL